MYMFHLWISFLLSSPSAWTFPQLLLLINFHPFSIYMHTPFFFYIFSTCIFLWFLSSLNPSARIYLQFLSFLLITVHLYCRCMHKHFWFCIQPAFVLFMLFLSYSSPWTDNIYTQWPLFFAYSSSPYIGSPTLHTSERYLLKSSLARWFLLLSFDIFSLWSYAALHTFVFSLCASPPSSPSLFSFYNTVLSW